VASKTSSAPLAWTTLPPQGARSRRGSVRMLRRVPGDPAYDWLF
jgi:hypothetical protein